MKTIKIKKEKNIQRIGLLNFEILTDFEMKKILGGEGDDDSDDEPIEW